jgi:hypothetical protein
LELRKLWRWVLLQYRSCIVRFDAPCALVVVVQRATRALQSWRLLESADVDAELENDNAPQAVVSIPQCTAETPIAVAAAAPIPAGQGLQYSIIMADTRALSRTYTIRNAPYAAIAAVLNFRYAKRQGYAFSYYLMDWDADSAERLGFKPSANPDDAPLAHPACYHAASCTQRHAAWSKILACWIAARDKTSDADPLAWTLYLDSDAVVNDQGQSVSDFLAEQRHRKMLSGPQVDRTVIAFANDLPYSPGMPNSGTFLFHGGLAAAEVFAHWWQAPAPAFATERPWEQGSLWTWFNSTTWGPRVTVMDTAPFMDVERVPEGGGGLWLRHYAGGHIEGIRRENLLADLIALGIFEKEFHALLGEIVDQHVVRVDVLDADARVTSWARERQAQRSPPGG